MNLNNVEYVKNFKIYYRTVDIIVYRPILIFNVYYSFIPTLSTNYNIVPAPATIHSIFHLHLPQVHYVFPAE